jgi:hypothetical protein
MGRGIGFILVLVAAATGFFLYSRQIQTLTPGKAAVSSSIDVIGVRNDLMAIANAERRYLAINGKYASLEDLRENGDIHIPSRPNYRYDTQNSDTSFKIIATYSGTDPKAPKRMSVDETMALKTETDN